MPLATSAPAYAETGKPAAADDATLLKYLQAHPGDVSGRVTIPDAKSGLLIQPEGREWRELRNGAVTILGYVLILGVLAVLVIFYLARGRIRIESGFSGPAHPALRRARALHPLADRDELHRARPDRPQHACMAGN